MIRAALLAGGAVLALGLFSGAALAKDLPEGGMTVKDVAKWLQDDGYKADIRTAKDGTQNVASATDGTNFYIYMYDCHDKPQCTALQFSIGFDTNGAWNAKKMNDWNSANRWTRAYVDDKDDPWVEMDVDLSPGGTVEGLDDEFSIWRSILPDFKKFINWDE